MKVLSSVRLPSEKVTNSVFVLLNGVFEKISFPYPKNIEDVRWAFSGVRSSICIGFFYRIKTKATGYFAMVNPKRPLSKMPLYEILIGIEENEPPDPFSIARTIFHECCHIDQINNFGLEKILEIRNKYPYAPKEVFQTKIGEENKLLKEANIDLEKYAYNPIEMEATMQACSFHLFMKMAEKYKEERTILKNIDREIASYFPKKKPEFIWSKNIEVWNFYMGYLKNAVISFCSKTKNVSDLIENYSSVFS